MFIGLHRHSHYSRRDAIAKIPDIVSRVAELGQTAWALTDHGTTSGLMEAYKETQKYNKKNGTNIKFIFGCEMYWVPNIYIKDRNASCHLLVLAKNETGYRNLLRLTTIAYGSKGKNPDQYFYTMRVTNEDIEACKEGLIFTSACMGGILNPTLPDTCEWDKDLAYERATAFRDMLGDDFFLEVQCATDEKQIEYNNRIIQMSRDLGIKTIVTEDSHYVNKSEASTHRSWLGLAPDSTYYQTDDYFIHSEQEVRDSMNYLPSDVVKTLIDNTQYISDMCEQVDIKFGGKNFPTLDLQGKSPTEVVMEKVRNGWANKVEGKVPEELLPKYKAQIEHEMKVLEKCDYLTYFLMTEDFISWGREHGIRMGIGRGSVGGCLVAYLLDITRIDPIKYNLIFERFAHDKRVTLPDVDVDVPNTKRQDIIAYLERRYGEVFHVRTFGTMASRGAIMRAAKCLGYSPEERNLITKQADGNIDAIEDKELRNLSNKFLGIIQSYGCHASAIMLFPSDATQWCAIEKQGGDYVCAYEYHDLEAMGLLKEDVLGIKTLDAIDGCVKMVKEHYGIDIDLDNLPDDDAKTFEMLQKLDVKGCFQIESGGMMNLISKMKPKSVFDLVPLVALYRPSTLQSGMTDEFVQCRAGDKPVHYLHPKLERALSETYGVLLYQEQAMAVVRDIAGYDLGKADMFRRAIGKKIPEEMARLIPEFVKDGESRGVDEATMNKLAEWLTNCAAYQFNKSHSAAYGVVCYQTAYLKAHFPAEYMCAYLNAYKGDKQEDMLPYIQDAKSHGIKLLPPDARETTCNWTIVYGQDGHPSLRTAINYISGIGDIPVPLDSISYKKLPKNKVENLIMAGALDFCGNRQALLKEAHSADIVNSLSKKLDTVLERIEKNKEIAETAREGTKKKEEAKRKVLKYSEQLWDIRQELQQIRNEESDECYDETLNEQIVLGFTFKDVFANYDTSKYSVPDKDDENTTRIVLGAVRRIKHWKQKNGKPMMFFTLECPNGQQYDIVMFNYVYTTLLPNEVYTMVLKGNKFLRLV